MSQKREENYRQKHQETIQLGTQAAWDAIVVRLSNVKDKYKLSLSTIGAILDINSSTLSRIMNDPNNLRHLSNHKISFISQLFAIDMGLSQVFGKENGVLWLCSINEDFNGYKPIDVMKTPEGLLFTRQHVDFLRGNA